jgi:hypothetical protein
MSNDERYRWISNHGDGSFGAAHDHDDLLHPDGNPPGATVTETYYFGFHVPEEAIHGYVYIWWHPNLDVVTAGALISRGFQHSALAADYFDFRTYLKTGDHIDQATGAMQFPMGLSFKMLQPMRRWQLKLDAKAADTSFDLDFTAVHAPIIRSDLKHLDQNMHVRGELVLRGHRHQVDCHQVRDRSWSNLRPEDPMPVAPYDWLTLTRGADFAMNISMFDDLAMLGNPGGALMVPPKLLQDGWVYRDGESRRIVSAEKRTTRTPGLMPLRHEVNAVDDRGQRYELVGESVGGCNWNGWHNMLWHQNLMRWSCNGEACWGESQEVQWQEAIRHLAAKPY